MHIILLGINHKTAQVQVRERLAMSRAQIKDSSGELKSIKTLKGVIVLSTCNRTELYLTTGEPEKCAEEVISFLSAYGGCSKDSVRRCCYIKEDLQAVHHLFRVAAGLDSMIIGESQILGQVVDAYHTAWECGLSNSLLNGLFQKVVSAGKRVRTETLIDRNSVSVGSAAVDMCQELFGELHGKRVLVLGAGETSELVVKHLTSHGVAAVIVANRTYEKAVSLAAGVGGTAIHLDAFPEQLKNADIVISCTSAPRYLINSEDLAPVQRERKSPLLFIDIAVPRDINPDVAKLDQVSIYDIDDLHQAVEKNLAERRKEAAKAELIINDELAEFIEWYETLAVVPAISALKKKAEDIKARELERAFRRLGSLNEREKKIISSLAGSITNKIISDPICRLKENAAGEKCCLYKDVLCELFNLQEKDPLERGESAL